MGTRTVDCSIDDNTVCVDVVGENDNNGLLYLSSASYNDPRITTRRFAVFTKMGDADFRFSPLLVTEE